MRGPLDGLLVVEIGGYITAPLAGAMLAQLGAEVVKVETPGAGDPFRNWSGTGSTQSPNFVGVNHNKLSVALDFHHDDGRRLLLDLLSRCDVVLQNLRPASLAAHGLDYDSVVAVNPRVVYCSISGFGDTGPYCDRPGYDTIGQALSGLLSVLVSDISRPAPVGTALSDHVTGIMAALAVVCGLYQRAGTGRGCHVATSLLESTLTLLAEGVGRLFETGEVPDAAHRSRVAQVYAFVASDGLPFVVHLSSPEKFWRGLTAASGRAELRDDPRFDTLESRRTNYDALAEELSTTFAGRPRAHWLGALSDHDVPSAPLNTLDEAVDDPQVRHLDLVVSTVPQDGSMPTRHVASPIRIDGHRTRPTAPPPGLGEHTIAVLARLGIGLPELVSLRDRGVIDWPDGK